MQQAPKRRLRRTTVLSLPVAAAPGGRYTVPSRNDCLACHEGAPVPVLGFTALQLSPDRDPLAPHAEPARNDHANLSNLVASGWLRNLPRRYAGQPPRIAAPSPTERAALGYLHGNCGHCHNDAGALSGSRTRARAAGRRRRAKLRANDAVIARPFEPLPSARAQTVHSASRAKAARTY